MDSIYNKKRGASEEEVIGFDTPVSQVIELFQKTKLAFTPIIKNGSVVAVLTIRDFLPLVKSKDNVENTPLSKIASTLTTIDKNTDVFLAIDIMLKKGIRNIGLTENEKETARVIGVVNDRSILEFLLSHNGRQIMENYEEKRISHIRISKSLKLYPLSEVPQNESIKRGANLLAEMERPFLILEGKDKIVTPWDIVMKTLAR
jgi:signal-transduction protein with cAMP-binding, CBS, and nucleotidyltransferase domain